MNFFWKKQQAIEDMIRQYLEAADACADKFADTFNAYADKGITPDVEALAEDTHGHESRADDIRRSIERELYGKALVPESRGDILGILEAIDRIPNKMESVLYQILLQQLSIPQEYIEDFKTLISINVEAYNLTTHAFLLLLDDMKEAIAQTDKVDARESESDRVERRLIRSIFSSSMDGAAKILIKELVLEIGAISDRAEDACDRIALVAIKRQV